MCWRLIPAVLLLSLPSIATAAGKPIAQGISWARAADDELSRPAHERLTGRTADDFAAAPSHWEGDMLFTPDGLGATALTALGAEPLHAMSYEPTGGILFVEMGGVTISPNCGNGDSANAALNCSPLVDSETQFPVYGNGMAQASMFQELQNYYEPFNIIMSSQRPPDWLPYTMAVIGGSSNQGAGVCGVANVACDGLKRNHVSLTFPESCGGVAEVAAQETSHNWGLEHVDDQSDLMYPFNNGGSKAYRDVCSDINHDTGGAVTQCDYIHEIYCAAGGGEQQNSYQELLGVFGPREVDEIAPKIISISPEDGTVLSVNDSVTLTAKVEENSRFVGAKWTWLDGLPEGTDEYTRCTNNVCTADYDLTPGTDPNGVDWDFVNLAMPPEGTYRFMFEVIDGYGNYDSQEITIEVTADGNTGPAMDTGEGSADGSDGTADSADGDATADGDGDGDGTGSGTGGSLTAGGDDDDKTGCACSWEPRREPMRWAWLLALTAVGRLARRRPRAAC